MNRLHWITGGITIISFLYAYIIDSGDLFRFALAIPGIISLLVVLYQEWNKHRLQEKNNDFILGAGAHMSELVYKKHAEFCEEYIKRIEEGRTELYRRGPSKDAFTIGEDLIRIRKKYTTWLTKSIEAKLSPFEDALIKIGADEHYLEHLGVGEERSRVVMENHELFRFILGIKHIESEKDADIQIDKMIEIIRDVLGISTLTDLRIKITASALKRLT